MALFGAGSASALDDALYSCVYAQLDIASALSGGAPLRPSFEAVPPGSDMDVRLQGVASGSGAAERERPREIAALEEIAQGTGDGGEDALDGIVDDGEDADLEDEFFGTAAGFFS